MVGIQGIGYTPEPANSKQANGSAPKDSAPSSLEIGQDGVVFSEEAKEAATVARLVEKYEMRTEIRAEEVARAKENVEQGTYKLVEVVEVVASRIARYLSAE
ncbi:MAG: flagellar biosynthesis anti-sigma factor FlgM [bacterium]|nr:flagellar biosynthesis anti-sigma factor FlgM [bacterium]